MKRQVKSLSVLQTGKILAIMFGFLSLIFVPFALIAFAAKPVSAAPMLIMVVMYPIMGFVSGIIMATMYNLSAGWIGGLEVTLEPAEFD